MDKRKFTSSPPQFIDGVMELHLQLHNAYKKALDLHNIFLGNSEQDNKTGNIYILVDFNENQDVEKIKGYFVFNHTICRFLPLEFDTALLFPVRNHGGGNIVTRSGITYGQIKEFRKERKTIIIRFSPIEFPDAPLYSTGKIEVDSILLKDRLDDIGDIVSNFSDIESLSLVDIPNIYLSRKYTIVGTQHYAPYTTTKDKYCVLFAENDNMYDVNAIKALRWIPTKKELLVEKDLGRVHYGGDVFFMLGYISKNENVELHSFMIENKCRLLFGKIEGNQIAIIGGIKMFQTNRIKYPKCLYNILIK